MNKPDTTAFLDSATPLFDVEKIRADFPILAQQIRGKQLVFIKCSHGATVGQLDKDMLFYLRTRAIDEETAKSLFNLCLCRRSDQ